MLNPQPMVVQGLVGECLLHRQFLATGFLGGHEHCDLGQRAGQEASILQEPTPRGQRRRGGLGNPLVMEATATVSLRKSMMSSACMRAKPPVVRAGKP
jgi:hypothetical protein